MQWYDQVGQPQNISFFQRKPWAEKSSVLIIELIYESPDWTCGKKGLFVILNCAIIENGLSNRGEIYILNKNNTHIQLLDILTQCFVIYVTMQLITFWHPFGDRGKLKFIKENKCIHMCCCFNIITGNAKEQEEIQFKM